MIIQKSDGSTTGWRFCVHSEAGGFVKLRLDQHFSSTHGFFDTTTAIVPINTDPKLQETMKSLWTNVTRSITMELHDAAALKLLAPNIV